MPSSSDKEIVLSAIDFARDNKKKIAKKLTDTAVFLPEEYPISVFMAGSPGAGKTETAKFLIETLSEGKKILHIDPDDLRKEFSDYDGHNSLLFQYPTSIIADKMQDMALRNSQSFVFDGTLTNLNRSKENIDRSLQLKYKREVFIVYVYQDPIQAWKFVRQREKKDGRSIPDEVFIQQYFAARENVNTLKEIFGKKIQVDIVVKNIDGTNFKYKENIDSVDSHIKERYSTYTLTNALQNVSD